MRLAVVQRQQASDEELASKTEDLKKELGYWESYLGSSPYVAGSQFSLAGMVAAKLTGLGHDSILKLCKLPTIASEVRFRRLRWLGHVSRMSDDRLPKKLLFGQMLGTGVRGRPMDSWNKIVCSDLLKNSF